ncbi:MAG: fimbrillin family protein, partial [Prevotella sp.]|nr:fimbrillin family protein [Prevotella sp.]
MILKRRNLVFRFLPGLFLSGLLLLSGCSQDDVSDVPAGSRAIGFRAQGAMSSLKATTTGAEHIQSFVVSANHGGDWTVADDYLLSAVTVYREGGIGDPDATAKWTYSPQAYFPTDKSSFVDFLAYSPAVSKNVTAGLKDAVDADQTITYKVPKPLATGATAQEDFLVAYQRVTGSADPGYGGPVNLQFRHALSRVLVAAGSSLTEPVVITGLVLRNLHTTGDLPMNSASTVWTPDPAKLDNYSYVLPDAGVSVTRYPVNQAFPSPLPLVTSYEQGMFVLPQLTAGTLNDAETAETAVENSNEFGLELHYTIGDLVKEPYYIQFADLNKVADKGVTFEAGKQYVLNLTFGSGSGTGGGGGGGSDQPTVDIGATISFGELGVDGYGPDITVPKPKVFEPVAVVWSQSNVYF